MEYMKAISCFPTTIDESKRKINLGRQLGARVNFFYDVMLEVSLEFSNSYSSVGIQGGPAILVYTHIFTWIRNTTQAFAIKKIKQNYFGRHLGRHFGILFKIEYLREYVRKTCNSGVYRYVSWVRHAVEEFSNVFKLK